jgi:hypothetical protein
VILDILAAGVPLPVTILTTAVLQMRQIADDRSLRCYVTIDLFHSSGPTIIGVAITAAPKQHFAIASSGSRQHAARHREPIFWIATRDGRYTVLD